MGNQVSILARLRSLWTTVAGGGAKTIPTPKVGDKIYVPSFLHLSHGVDDFLGGICTVTGVREDRIGRKLITFVNIEEDPDSWMNWETYLAPQQEQLRQEYGERLGRRKPDYRPEFNE
jgi:hypothetical protein